MTHRSGLGPPLALRTESAEEVLKGVFCALCTEMVLERRVRYPEEDVAGLVARRGIWKACASDAEMEVCAMVSSSLSDVRCKDHNTSRVRDGREY